MANNAKTLQNEQTSSLIIPEKRTRRDGIHSGDVFSSAPNANNYKTKQQKNIPTVDDGHFVSTTCNPFDRHPGQGGCPSIGWQDEEELPSRFIQMSKRTVLLRLTC